MPKKKTLISLNIFPSLDAIELVSLSQRDGSVEKAATLPLEFDQTSRQITDVDQATQAIKGLYDRTGVPLSSPSVLVLPSYFTREIEIPDSFTDEEIRLSLISESERFYIFKKQEPHVAWLRLKTGKVLYSAFPQAEIEKFIQIFQELKTPLVGIELNYFSMLRGLVVTGTILEQVAISQKWCLLVVSDMAVFVALMEGQHILKADESPLSVGVGDDTTTLEIVQDFERFVSEIQLNKLILVNNSARVQTDALINALSSYGELVIMEQNASTLLSRGAKNGMFPCTLEAIGGSFYSQFPEMSAVNFLPDGGADLASVINMQERAFKGLLFANAGAVALCLALFGALTIFSWFKEMMLHQMTGQIDSFQTIASVPFQRGLFVKRSVESNVRINDLFVHLGRDLGDGMWLNTLQVNNDVEMGSLNTEITGGSLSPSTVESLQTDLNKDLQWEGLKISTVEQSFLTDGQRYFTWVVKTMDPKKQKEPSKEE